MVKYVVLVSILQKHQGLDVALFGGVGDTAPLGIVAHADHVFESAAVLSQHAVQLHRGTIALQSEPGKGTCIRVCFPAK